MKKKFITLLLMILFLSFLTVSEAFSSTFYVDASLGKDSSSWGTKPDKPWQTITYSVQQTSLIEAYNEVLIKVAPGTYNEAINIDIRPMSLEGSGADTIIDGGGQDVITIVGVEGVRIKSMIVQNGNYGINGIRGAIFEVEDTIIQNNANDGIRMDENSASRLFDLTVQRNGDEGIEVIRNSSAAFSGSIVSSQNKSAGLAIAANSSVWCEEQSTLTIKENGEQGSLQGIRIGNSSNFIAFSWTTITIQGNHGGGVGMVRNSSMSVHGSTFLVKENLYGLTLSTSTLFASNIEVTDNSGIGIVADDGSSVDFRNSKITDNTAFDVYLTFCSRATLYGDIGLVYCDECSRIRGDAVCQ